MYTSTGKHTLLETQYIQMRSMITYVYTCVQLSYIYIYIYINYAITFRRAFECVKFVNTLIANVVIHWQQEINTLKIMEWYFVNHFASGSTPVVLVNNRTARNSALIETILILWQVGFSTTVVMAHRLNSQTWNFIWCPNIERDPFYYILNRL